MLNQYTKEVLTLDKSIFIASCLWLEKMEAITNNETQEILSIRKHRYEVAHKLPEYIIDDNVNINIKYLFKMQEILKKIDVWWIKEVELTINPDFKNVNREELDVKSGSMLLLNHLLSILKSNGNLNNKNELPRRKRTGYQQGKYF
jgi:hypothetical protein